MPISSTQIFPKLKTREKTSLLMYFYTLYFLCLGDTHLPYLRGGLSGSYINAIMVDVSIYMCIVNGLYLHIDEVGNLYLQQWSHASIYDCLFVFFKTYWEKNQWVATQLPLSNTVTDFWKLILEHDIAVILQLETIQVSFPSFSYCNRDHYLHYLVIGSCDIS